MIENFRPVDLYENIYRGGQPDNNADYEWMVNLGINRILRLNPGSEQISITDPIVVIYHPITILEQVIELSQDKLRSAVLDVQPHTFIHCEHGEDRTGLVCACYRVTKQQWFADDAEKEMLALGFHKELFGLWKAWRTFTGQPF